jgi:hypothetical protein
MLGPVPKKKSFCRWGPWVISYQLSHKRARSANPMRSSSGNRTPGEARTIAYWKYAKNDLIELYFIGIWTKNEILLKTATKNHFWRNKFLSIKIYVVAISIGPKLFTDLLLNCFQCYGSKNDVKCIKDVLKTIIVNFL